MSQEPHHSRRGYQSDTDRINHHQGLANHLSAFVSGQIDGDSDVIFSSHASSSRTVESELMQIGLQRRKLDYCCDPAHRSPRPEADPKSLVSGAPPKERTLRRKPKCRDLRAKAAYQATMSESASPQFDGPGLRAANTSLSQNRTDPSTCLVAEPPEQEKDSKDGRRTRRGHRATERPLSHNPSLNALTDSYVENEPRKESSHDPRSARQVSQQSHNRPEAQAVSQVQARGAGFLTSQEWQHHPTTHGPGSPYEIARTLRETAQPKKPILHAEEETHSNASTLVSETQFNPIAGLDGFDGVPTIRGGYHYPRKLRHFSTPPPARFLVELPSLENVLYENTLAEEIILQNVPARVLSAGNVARARRGYPASAFPRPADSGDDDTQQEAVREAILGFTSISAFGEYSIPTFQWQRHSPSMTEVTSLGLPGLPLSLCECLREFNW